MSNENDLSEEYAQWYSATSKLQYHTQFIYVFPSYLKKKKKKKTCPVLYRLKAVLWFFSTGFFLKNILFLSVTRSLPVCFYISSLFFCSSLASPVWCVWSCCYKIGRKHDSCSRLCQNCTAVCATVKRYVEPPSVLWCSCSLKKKKKKRMHTV